MFRKLLLPVWSTFVDKDNYEVRIDYIDGKKVGYCSIICNKPLYHSEISIKKFLKKFKATYSRVPIPPEPWYGKVAAEQV